MKKTIFGLILCLTAAALLLSCVSCAQAPAEEKRQNDPAPTPESEPYSLTYKGVKLTPGADAAEAVRAIDETPQYEESGSCAGEGKDKLYTYSSVRIETLYLGGKDVINALTVLNDLVATEKGITVGSSEAAVITAYGENGGGNLEDRLIYVSAGTELRVFLKDHTVTKIQILKAE